MTEVAQLQVQSDPDSNGGMGVAFDAETMGLVLLGGDGASEHWSGPEDQFWMGSGTHSDPVQDDPAPVVERAYLTLFNQAREAGFDHALRIWQFIPGINAGQGDQERYRRFCVGRAQALEQLGLRDDQMCAATAIGCCDDVFRLTALFGRQPGVAIENPRQVSAWNYPSQYGPVSPAFARGTLVALDGQSTARGMGMMVSGTAAVVGHASAHPDDVLAQTQEAIANADAVLSEAKKNQRARDYRLTTPPWVRAYVRHASDWLVVEQAIRHHWPQAHLMGFEGAICRSDLLVEIELWQAHQPS